MALTADRLREAIDYDPLTGLFQRPGRAPVAGTDHGSGYLIISLDGKTYRAHRLAWLYVKGKWPRWTIDHKNGIKTDNRFANLRDVSIRLNTHNDVNRKPVREGAAIGVERRERDGKVKWRARIGHFGRLVTVGTFDTQAEAAAAYAEAKAAFHIGSTTHKFPQESRPPT